MTFSYDSSIASDSDEIRLRLGDTVEATALLQDEEITWALTREAEPTLAAAILAEGLAARFAREVDKSSDGDSISSSQRFKHFKELAEALRDEAERTGVLAAGMPYAGGISVSDKEARQQNNDRVPAHFKTGMHDQRVTSRPWVSE